MRVQSESKSGAGRSVAAPQRQERQDRQCRDQDRDLEPRWLCGRLERQLPRYYGHEWMRVRGNDLVLILVSTRLINDVQHHIFN